MSGIPLNNKLSCLYRFFDTKDIRKVKNYKQVMKERRSSISKARIEENIAASQTSNDKPSSKLNEIVRPQKIKKAAPSFQHKINTNINIEDIKLTSEQLIPIGLILNELISNSLEHAFVDKKEGEIYFSLSSSKAKEITIIIGDNGIGIPSNLDALRKGSVGIDLVNVFVDQLNGQITCLNRKGTFYELKFK